MSLKNILLSGLFAASAIAAPATEGNAGVQKRGREQWCGLHIEEDASQIKPDRKIYIQILNDKQDEIYHHDTLQVHEEENKITFEAAPLDHTMYLSVINSGENAGRNHYLAGWTIRYGGDTFTTDSEQCHPGKEAGPGSEDTGDSRSTRKYDCGFNCVVDE